MRLYDFLVMELERRVDNSQSSCCRRAADAARSPIRTELCLVLTKSEAFENSNKGINTEIKSVLFYKLGGRLFNIFRC